MDPTIACLTKARRNFRLRKLAATVTVDDASGHIAAPGHGIVESTNGQSRFHPWAMEQPTIRFEYTSLIAHM